MLSENQIGPRSVRVFPFVLYSVSLKSFDGTGEAGISSPKRPTIEELYEQNASEAMRLAYLLTGDSHLAQDVAHDAFIRVVGRYQHMSHPDSFDSYLRRAVVNITRDHFRRLKRHREILRLGRPRRDETIDLPNVAERDWFLQLLTHLPSRQRIAVVLRYYEDLSEQQVAEAMDCSLSAARSLITRAIKNLRADIDLRRNQDE